MRILAITHQYPTSAEPGFAPYNRQQFDELATRHALRVIRPVRWPTAIGERWHGRRVTAVEGTRRDIDVRCPTFWYPPRLLHHRYGWFFARSIDATAHTLLEQHRPDVLLSTWAHPDGWATVRLGRRVGIPVVVKVIGSDVLVQARGRRRQRVAEALSHAHAVIAVSRDLAARVIELGVPSSVVHVIPEGVDEEFSPAGQQGARSRLGLPAHERIILFVGSVLVSKGVTELVEACAILRDRKVACRCWMVGSGADHRRIQQLIHAHRLDRLITLTGPRPHGELVDWYRASDLVALPSHSEGIPNVLREALACGRPFVATRVGGIPEIADPASSRLVPVGDVRALADALAAGLDEPMAVDMAWVRHVNISWRESTDRLGAVLQSVVDASVRSVGT